MHYAQGMNAGKRSRGTRGGAKKKAHKLAEAIDILAAREAFLRRLAEERRTKNAPAQLEAQDADDLAAVLAILRGENVAGDPLHRKRFVTMLAARRDYLAQLVAAGQGDVAAHEQREHAAIVRVIDELARRWANS